MSEPLRRIVPIDGTPVIAASATLPTASQWLKHSVLFFLTALTTTIAGLALAVPADLYVPEPPALSALDYVLFIPKYYIRSVAVLLSFASAHPAILLEGLAFSGSLLAILLAHELGHYLACRVYGVNATLPFFLPAPPLFIAGTFGAFIKIRSPVPSRRALFDIGLAGPLAGFLVTLPIAVLGIVKLGPPIVPTGHEIIFNDPLLMRLLSRFLGVWLDPYSPTNPYYFAAWIGLLVTSLNLMPVGQLDGGHGTYAVFGARAHRWIGRTAFLAMALLAVVGWFWHGSPSGFLYVVLLGVMLRVRHPQPCELEPLGARRIVIALVTLVVFALSFWPFPITLT